MNARNDFVGATVAFTNALAAPGKAHVYRTLLLRAQAFVCLGHHEAADSDCRRCAQAVL